MEAFSFAWPHRLRPKTVRRKATALRKRPVLSWYDALLEKYKSSLIHASIIPLAEDRAGEHAAPGPRTHLAE